MEEKLRRKVWAWLVVLLVGFGWYCGYLVTVHPENRAVVYTYIDFGSSDLDSWNFSEMQTVFYQPSFLENYTVGSSTMEPKNLEIKPKHNSDVVIFLCQYGNDIYFKADGYMMVGAFGTSGNWLDLKNEIADELTTVLGYIDHAELVQDPYWDDYDFATIPSFFHIFGFFGLLALILVYCFMIVFRNGKLLENVGLKAQSDSVIFGLLMIYFSTGFGLMDACIMVLGKSIAILNTGCLIVCALLFVLGLYLIVRDGRKLTQ